MATLSGFTRPADPIDSDQLSTKVSTDIGKAVWVYVDSAQAIAAGNISEADRAAIQASISAYAYVSPQLPAYLSYFVDGTGTLLPARLGSGTPNSSTFLRGDRTFAVPPTPTKTDVGLSNVDNTSDANKPLSTAESAALAGKAASAHAHVLTRTDVGLANVDNTSDANKPVSTATTTALGSKADTSAMNSALSAKADATATTNALAAKADAAATTTALAGKAAVPVYVVLANGTVAMAFGTNSAVKVTPTATASFTTTVPPAGSVRHLIILTAGASSFTITFGAGFKPTATLATGITAARVFVLSFISDGTNLYEVSRTVAMVA